MAAQGATRTGSRLGGRGEARFPFTGYPRGWFAVAFSEEVSEAAVHRMRYFGQDLVAYRGDSGQPHVVGAYCPHLGAHLGHGGVVEGEGLRCPFHGWRFGADGRCAEVPYADKIPPRARLEVWPTREQNGVIFVHHDADGGPAPELPPLEEEGWTRARTVIWPGLRTHAQEVFENTVDLAHLRPVHDGRAAKIVSVEHPGPDRLDVSLEFDAPGDVVGMPGTLNHVCLDVRLFGLGHVVVSTHVPTADVRARQRIYATPIDEGSIDLRGVVQVVETDDPEFTEELAEIFYRAYVEDFAKDFPIWEHKRYVTRPMLAKGDGPIAAYRRWCAGLYPEAPAPTSAPDVPAAALRRDKRGVRELVASAFDALRARAAEAELVPWLTRPSSEPSDEAPTTSASVAPRPSPGDDVAAPRSAAAVTLPVSSAEHYLETLPERFVPAAADGVDAVFQWELGGEGGATFHALVQRGALAVARGAHPKPTVTLSMTAADYVRVVNGELDGMRAFTSGKGRVKGSVRAAMKMRTLFPQ